MGVKIKDRRLRDNIADEDIIKLKKEGETQKEMSEILGVLMDILINGLKSYHLIEYPSDKKIYYLKINHTI
ncbi:MAG: hypothetical protein U0M74_07825 [Methanobrevibacter smithii]|nr:hypothetical protein [Methanobrevibacter smithii]